MLKKEILLMVVLLFSMNLVIASPFYYKVSMNYNKGNINIKDISVIFSQENLKENYGDYIINVININNGKIDSQNFIVPNIRMYDTGDDKGNIIGGGEVVLDEVSFEIYAPYYENAKEIVVYDKDNKELTKADISMFSKTKANGLVNEVDEISKDRVDIQKEIKRTNEITEKSSGNILEKITSYWWILLIILVVLIIILFYPRKVKKNR